MISLGYGSVSSFGHGFGSGAGAGYGYGFCYGSGAGTGWGDGFGYSIGDGYSYGAGCGAGDGVLVATLGEREVYAFITPWGRVVRVGCQVHSLDTWRERWRAIAQEHGVTVSADEVARLIALIEAAPMGPEWLPSEERGARDRGVAGA